LGVLITWFATKVLLRKFNVSVRRLDQIELRHAIKTPPIPLRRMFSITTAFALLIGMVRSIPEHIMDTTPFVTISSAIALLFLGIATIVTMPDWTALSRQSGVARFLLFATATLMFGPMVPLCFLLPRQAWLSCFVSTIYVMALMYVTILPWRQMGFRLVSEFSDAV